MSQTFKVIVNSSTEEFMAKAHKLAREHGALLTGDNRSGSFSASGVNGEYSMADNTVSITVTKKPFCVPWSMVEKRAKDFFTEG